MRVALSFYEDRTEALLLNRKSIIVDHQVTFHENNSFLDLLPSVLEKLLENQTTNESISHVFFLLSHLKKNVQKAKNLNKVGILRIAGHKPDLVTGCPEWPTHIKKAIYTDTVSINGGYDYDGNEITPISKKEVHDAVKELIEKGARSFAVTGTFSPMFQEHEDLVARYISEVSNYPVSKSFEVGDVGFLERENGCVLNAALTTPQLEKEIKQMKKAFERIEVDETMYTIKSDGSLVHIDDIPKFPALLLESENAAIFSGTKNLTQYNNAVVCYLDDYDVRMGVMRDKKFEAPIFERLTCGIPVKFDMPSMDEYAMGAQSVAYTSNKSEDMQSKVDIGPEFITDDRIDENKHVSILDAAITCSNIDLEERKRDLDTKDAFDIVEAFEKKLLKLKKGYQGFNHNLPLVLVGPRSDIITQQRYIHVPQYSTVVATFGVATANLGRGS